MAENILLVYNIPTGAASWFGAICNIHPDVKAWPIITDEQRKPIDAPGTQVEWMSGFIRKQYETNPKTTLAFIRVFSIGDVKFCLSIGGRIIQLLRNPIGITGKRMCKACKKKNLAQDPGGPEELFGRALNKFAGVCTAFLKNADKYPLVKVEDLNTSLLHNHKYFIDIMEYITQVPWTEKLVNKILNLWKTCSYCNGSGLCTQKIACDNCKGIGKVYDKNKKPIVCPVCKGQRYHRADEKVNCIACGGKASKGRIGSDDADYVWNMWFDWQKKMFKDRFGGIIGKLGYKYPDG